MRKYIMFKGVVKNRRRIERADPGQEVLDLVFYISFIQQGGVKGLEMSVFELLAIAREVQGADYVTGDRILCKKRYAKDIDHMLEFRILGNREPYGKVGEHCRRFLSGEAYRQMREKERQKRIRIIHYARVRDQTLVYGPATGRPASKGE